MAMDPIEQALRKMEKAIRKEPDRFTRPAYEIPDLHSAWQLQAAPAPDWQFTTGPVNVSHTHQITPNTNAPYIWTTTTSTYQGRQP